MKRKSKDTPKRKKTKAQFHRAAVEAADNRPWYDRATDRNFWSPESGSHTVILTGEVTERVNNFGSRVIDIPTNRGVITTGSFALMRPLAAAYKKHKTLTGRRVSLIVKGEGIQRRFVEVQVL